MIYFKSKEEIELIRESSLLVGKTLAEVARFIAPGVTTGKLDKIAEEFIRRLISPEVYGLQLSDEVRVEAVRALKLISTTYK